MVSTRPIHRPRTPIEILLNAEDTEERDTLIARWRDNKLSELNFVGVVVCFSHSLPDILNTVHIRVSSLYAVN